MQRNLEEREWRLSERMSAKNHALGNQISQDNDIKSQNYEIKNQS